MARVIFYHITRGTLEETLTQILERALAAGMQVDLRGADAARLDHLDQALWLGAEDGFLPHGLAGGRHDAAQPVLLTTATTARAGTACVMAVDGAGVTPDEALRLDRVCILFDGRDEAAVAGARTQWRSLVGAGAPAEYWSQEDGPWRLKTASART